jgi:hypothetical protein
MSTGYVAQLFLSICGFQIRNLAESLKNPGGALPSPEQSNQIDRAADDTALKCHYDHYKDVINFSRRKQLGACSE